MDDGPTIEVTRCACGLPARSKCAEEIIGLIRCLEPVCGEKGQWCSQHRHKPGTMGYLARGEVRADFQGFVPERRGLWEAIRVLWHNLFWGPQRKANQALQDELRHWPPPAPIPAIRLRVAGRTFASRQVPGRGYEMVEETGKIK